MKRLGETRAIELLREQRESARAHIAENYEHRARSCEACETRGACCLDEHFVNVRITRLEAAAMKRVVDSLPEELQRQVAERVERAIGRYGLSNGGQKYACPLFDRQRGCLVHEQAKPFPCIQHACYERAEDLPPDDLIDRAEELVARLDRRTYGSDAFLPMPIPLALRAVLTTTAVAASPEER